MKSVRRIRKMILDILQEVSPTIYKEYMPDTAKDPDDAHENMAILVEIARKHLMDGCRNFVFKVWTDEGVHDWHELLSFFAGTEFRKSIRTENGSATPQSTYRTVHLYTSITKYEELCKQIRRQCNFDKTVRSWSQERVYYF